MKQILAFCAILAVCVAEAPLSGPYPASGWKPKGAQFSLPGQFLPQQQQRQNQGVDVEVTKEQVNFAGQSTETQQATTEPSNSYLPPSDTDYADENTESDNTDYLKVQGLPAETTSEQFRLPQNGQLNQFRSQNNRQFSPTQEQQQQNYNFNKQQQFGRILQQQNRQQQAQIQQQQYQQQAQFGRQSALPARPQPQPSNAYGAPSRDSTPDNDTEDEEVIQDSDESEQPAVAVSNSVQNGRYYVLTPDNTLQRVLFMTSQNEEEVRSNGFTAQLRYMPVEPIRDPIYAYNEQGTLVRVYRK